MISYSLQDCLTDGHKRPVWDASQDWHVTNLTENGGITTMEFYRLRNTNDAEGDNVIDVSSKFFLNLMRIPSEVADSLNLKRVGKTTVFTGLPLVTL